MLIECDMSRVPHSRGSNEWIASAIVDPVQCQVLLERGPIETPQPNE